MENDERLLSVERRFSWFVLCRAVVVAVAVTGRRVVERLILLPVLIAPWLTLLPAMAFTLLVVANLPLVLTLPTRAL